jgi:hypothetical protein
MNVTFPMALLLSLIAAQPAFAYGNDIMTCSKATMMIANAPGIESNAILNMVARQWQQLDLNTMAAGHPAIEPIMLGQNGFHQLTNQCALNPGELLRAAAFQIYQSDREQLDGY